MNPELNHVAIVGGGVAGLTAADALAGWGVRVSLFEKSPFLGGHAIQLGCKATEACVKCGACVAQEKLLRATGRANVTVHAQSTIDAISGHGPYHLRYRSRSSPTTQSGEMDADAILVATGFSPVDPSDKPYGYGQFPNVITSLEAERLLRENWVMKRPSDGRVAQRLAFIQCVGSRDASQGRPWCSKICCGSSMRMARLIQSRQKDVRITFFYIDVQTFGKDFQCFYQRTRQSIAMIRSIPGDIVSTGADELEVIYFDPQTNASTEARFDVVVLSVGLAPSDDNLPMAQLLGLTTDESGFLPPGGNDRHPVPAGIFTAGAATGPMSIAESVSSAEKTVYDIAGYLGVR